MKVPVSVIILTYNEELNLENCLKSIKEWAEEVFIVDSYSTDKTLEIAKKYGCKITQHVFKNQARQFNFALENLKIKSDWILRLDADEKMTDALWWEISAILPEAPANINGFYINRRFYFMGRWLKHAGVYPVWLLRLFRRGKAKSELKEIDEHIILLEGRAEKLKNDFIHDNRKNLYWWIQKHNDYSSREVETILNLKPEIAALGGQAKRKRWLKEKFYYRLPLFWRAIFYFHYVYFCRLGFLDGKEGIIYHFLRIYWYRFLLDAKIYEEKKKHG